MKMKTRIIGLAILALLTLCLLNVAAASTTNPATAPHSKIVTDVKGQQPTTLTFTSPAQVKVNESYTVSGSLTSGGTGVSGATINFQYQYLDSGRWVTLWTDTTNSNGNIADKVAAHQTGDHHNRLTYDGNSQYAPAVSNEVVVTVS